jgi:hypothetical protein
MEALGEPVEHRLGRRSRLVDGGDADGVKADQVGLGDEPARVVPR